MNKFLEKIGIKRARNLTVKTTNPTAVSNEVQKRIIVFGLLIVLSLSLLIVNLFRIQVLSNDAYKEKLDNYTRRFETITTPRGEILDRNQNIVVGNKISKSIIYYPPLGQSTAEQWELAQKIADNFTIKEDKMSLSDLQDLYLFLHDDKVKQRISEQENLKYLNNEYTSGEYHQLKKNKITESDLEELTDNEKKAYIIYQRMIMPTSGGMKTILTGVSNEEIAYLAEHNLDYPGFQSYSNWERDYLEDFGLKSIIGSVSNEVQGLPLEKIDYYLAKDYVRNERLGRSGLELYYEDIVSGNKKVQNVVYSSDGFAQAVEVREGSKGDNLILTIDLNLQAKTEEIAKKYIEQAKGDPNRKYFESVYLLVMNPKNGDILSSVAIKTSKDGILYNDPSSNHLDTIIPGSTIKGAMVYLGLSEGVVSPTEQISDAPIKIASTPAKGSFQTNLVSTNAVSALAQSSNVYMFHVAMRVANARYEYNQPLFGVDMKDFQTLKHNFSRFGLGTQTGIDMPREAEGYVGKNFQAGFLLDYAMGQYDSYTPIQLATYINTIANNGIRVKPRYVQYAKDPLTDIIVFENKTEIVSVLDDKAAIAYVQQGLRECVTSGLCRGVLNHNRYSVAAKTGTSENTYKTKDGEYILTAPHSLLTAYAPFENPEVTVTCAAPNSMNDKILENICQPIANEVLDFYFNNK